MVCKDNARSFWAWYINGRVFASFADHMSNVTLAQAETPREMTREAARETARETEAEGMHAVAQTSNAILARLKEVEITNTGMVSIVDKLKAEISARDDKIKELSADKRKDMEQMIDTAVEKWLNSLTDVPEDVRQQFKKGIYKIAEQADVKNAAWEIVCNASLAHESNVKKIDELLKTCSEQGETIKTLMATPMPDPSFATESSRMAGSKRTRMESEAPAAAADRGEPVRGEGGDAWMDFEKMMKLEMTSKYF